MAGDANLDPLVPVLSDLSLWLRKSRCPSLIIGGIAASMLGRPRATKDIDVLILRQLDKCEEFINTGREFGFEPRIKDAVSFVRKHRTLLSRHARSGVDIDISFGMLPFEEEAVQRGKKLVAFGAELALPAPEDLIIMKAVAHRPQDLIDIEAVLDRHPSIDCERIRRWVREFAEVLEAPEILKDIERLIKRKGRASRPTRPFPGGRRRKH